MKATFAILYSKLLHGKIEFSEVRPGIYFNCGYAK